MMSLVKDYEVPGFRHIEKLWLTVRPPYKVTRCDHDWLFVPSIARNKALVSSFKCG
jgi:hypothetical protein